MLTKDVLSHCPQCETDLRPYLEIGDGLDYCLRCQLPLVLLAGKYRLLGVLGEGGFGTVYKAKHVSMTRDPDRVIKVMKPEIIDIPGMHERFFREVQMTSALSQQNEHIVRVHDDFGQIPRLGHFYVMEFLQGRPLADYLEEPDDMPPLSWCLSIFEQLCDAMQAAHDDGIVHRDLKPENLLLIEKRKSPYFLKVLDFGIAKPMGSEDSQSTKLTQGILGSPFYLSPEQAMNKTIDHRTDIYAMGIILYEMLTGEIPWIPLERMAEISVFELISLKVKGGPPPSACNIRPDRGIPRPIDAILERALAFNPDDRFDSVDEFWSHLEPFVAPLKAADVDLPLPKRPSDPKEPASGSASQNIRKASNPSKSTPPGSGMLSEKATAPGFANTHEFLVSDKSLPEGEIVLADRSQIIREDEEHRTSLKNKQIKILGSIVALLLCVVGGVAFWRMKSPNASSLQETTPVRAPIVRKSVARLLPVQRERLAPVLKRVVPVVVARPRPVERRVLRRVPPRRLVRRRRRRRRRRRVAVIRRRLVIAPLPVRRVAPVSPCGLSETFLKIRPSSGGVGVLVSRGQGRVRRRAGGFCLPGNAGMVNLERKGYDTCFFKIRGQKKVRVRLLEQGKNETSEPDYCLRVK